MQTRGRKRINGGGGVRERRHERHHIDRNWETKEEDLTTLQDEAWSLKHVISLNYDKGSDGYTDVFTSFTGIRPQPPMTLYIAYAST